MNVRIIARHRDGSTSRIFFVTYPVTTKKAARRMAREEFPLPTHTLGNSWKASA